MRPRSGIIDIIFTEGDAVRPALQKGTLLGALFALDKLESPSNLMEAEFGNPLDITVQVEQEEQKFA